VSVMGGASTDCATCIYSRHTPTHVTKKKHRHYKPCLPQGHYGCHILCFHLLTCRIPHAVGHGLILLMMDIIMPETCSDRMVGQKHQISCILLVLSLHLIVIKMFNYQKYSKQNNAFQKIPRVKLLT